MKQNYWGLFYLAEGFQIDPRFNLDIKFETDPSIVWPTENIWLFVETTGNKITKILATEPVETLITKSIIDTIKEQNLKIMNELQSKMISSKYEKPSELFMHEMNWNLINATVDLKKYPLLIGPKGCGKTQTAQSIAQSRGMKFYPINCGSIFKPKQTLVGQMQAKDGTTFLLSSEFLQHFQDDCEEGVLIFLDEISRIPPAAANYFMTILDRIQSYIYIEEEGRQVKKGKNVVFIAAANFGYEYSDTRNLDGALIDRFMKFLINYLPEKEEVELIQKRVPTASITDVKRLVKFATMFREEEEKLRVAVSTRQLIDMAEYLPLGYNFNTIFDNIFLNLFVNGTMDERDTVKKMVDSIR